MFANSASAQSKNLSLVLMLASSKGSVKLLLSACLITIFFLLVNRKLTWVPDLSRFHFLRKLWLNNNKVVSLNRHVHDAFFFFMF